ncbi:hypothetical protein QBC44DRAFT_242802 [Cladorrhinum sp. PSN332]|nr:hypothetical protein QBC44DRAFT_242802 [Cladorrhinum sp. PSN332]
MEDETLLTTKPSSIFSAYKYKLGRRPRKEPEQGQEASNLVEGLVDYLRVLEDRVLELEQRISDESDDSSDPDREALPAGEEEIVAVEPTIKLYPIGRPTSYHPITLTRETRRGIRRKRRWQAPENTYACEHDTQHLIRAVYVPNPPRGPSQKDRPDQESQAEDPENVAEIQTFSVTSTFITSFFSAKLPSGPGHFIMRFYAPFKPVLRHLDALRAELPRLERLFGHEIVSCQVSFRRDEPQTKPPSDHVAGPQNPTPDSGRDVPPLAPWVCPEALTHFRVLIEFIDKYLAREVNLYHDLRAGSMERVAFENLWMLFEAGDTIFCPLREPGREAYLTTEGHGRAHRPVQRYTPQGYRVVATEGGLPISGSPARQHVYYTHDGNPRRPPISSRVRGFYTDFRVYCYFIDFNGKEYGSVRDVFVFKPYERELDIRSLQAYPIVFADGSMLLNRGFKFVGATVVSHMQYEGLTVGANREEASFHFPSSFLPVVVDTKLAFEGDSSLGSNQVQAPKFISGPRFWLSKPLPHGLKERGVLLGAPACQYPRCQNLFCIPAENWSVDSTHVAREKTETVLKALLEEQERADEGPSSFQKKMEETDMIRLLPGTVPGFALRNRKWVLLDLNLLKPVEQNHEWKHLVLPKGHRTMVQAMVETHTAQSGGGNHVAKAVGMDLVRGKGKGCIILLHGVPGVGKTSTAGTKSSLSEGSGFLCIPCQTRCEWTCKCEQLDSLVDTSQQRDVQRNGLVSVFLRILEYYSGILFLTTNRVGAIDDAFRSRLHLTLYYPRLNKDQTIKIFKRNFKRMVDINDGRIKRGLLPFECQKSEMKAVVRWAEESWKKLRWNGRQIRNTFQTGLALAEFDARGNGSGPTSAFVTKTHFKIVASASLQFNQYLKQTHGHDEDDIARRDLTRAANFTLEMEGSSSDEESSSSAESDETDSSGTEADSEETDDDSDHGKRKKKHGKTKSRGQKGSKSKTASGKSGSKSSNKKAKADEEVKAKGDKKTKEKQRKKKDEKEEEEESVSSSDDSE